MAAIRVFLFFIIITGISYFIIRYILLGMLKAFLKERRFFEKCIKRSKIKKELKKK